MLHDEAMRFLSQRSGKQFDPAVVEAMSQLSPNDGDEASSSSEAEMIVAGLSGITASQLQPTRS
jgi:HD-GYP domain-containing protein (c-di-GMP phosphodiesterase class II)